MGFGNLGVKEATDTFLVDGKSFNLSKEVDTGKQTIIRNNDIPLSQEEIFTAGDFYNIEDSEVEWADITSWDDDNYLEVKGASFEDVEEILNDPKYKTIFRDAAEELPSNISFADAIEGGGILKSIGGMNTGKAYGGAYDADPQSLVYPLNRDPEEKFDYLQVVGYEYIPGMSSKDWTWDAGISKKEEGGYDAKIQNFSRPSSRYTSDARKKNILGTARLPMTGALSESNTVGWGADNLDALTQAGARLAAAGIDVFTGGNIDQIFDDAGDTIKNLIGDVSKEQIKTFFAGEAVGANIFTRGTGMILNPNLELLFNGPNLRTFQYSFNFIPREPAEARNIRNIIRFFKQNMAPKRDGSGTFLESPNIFQLKYLTDGGQDHPFLNHIKLTALTNFTVNYTPSNQYMTYEENKSMTAYQVGMTFNELEPVLFDDFNEGEIVGAVDGDYSNARVVGDNYFSMGY